MRGKVKGKVEYFLFSNREVNTTIYPSKYHDDFAAVLSRLFMRIFLQPESNS